jgi:hypothetical protein
LATSSIGNGGYFSHQHAPGLHVIGIWHLEQWIFIGTEFLVECGLLNVRFVIDSRRIMHIWTQ